MGMIELMDGLAEPPPKIVIAGIGSCGLDTLNYIRDRGVVGTDFIDGNDARLFDESDNPISGADMLFVIADARIRPDNPVAAGLIQAARAVDLIFLLSISPVPDKGEQPDEDQHILLPWANSQFVINGRELLALSAGRHRCAVELGHQLAFDIIANIAELITGKGLVGVDLADIHYVTRNKGRSTVGTGVACGENRACEATMEAVNHPLLGERHLQSASGVLVVVRVGFDLSIREFNIVGDIIKEFCADDATIVVGTVVEPMMINEMQITVIATGIQTDHDQ